MHRSQWVLQQLRLLFLTAAFSSPLDRCGFPAVGIILVTLPFFSLQAFHSHKCSQKKKQVSCGKIWSASWTYVYVTYAERVLDQSWNRGKRHVNPACVVTLPSFECTAVYLGGVLRQWEEENIEKQTWRYYEKSHTKWWSIQMRHDVWTFKHKLLC